ncbi:MAG: hypothetical protein ACD_3C00057G0005 [uncultured bacterium (gcode 4)]|uniref:Uncharacterized protein n=1 Tax=uncultured bacterium (gcode 4) TaxID=1234023 RepID=K2GYB0_9BACT|nr:MAG: hypothetical protein ACD_3C00057G0005 [uncultured bacterium (gcode 4)]
MEILNKKNVLRFFLVLVTLMITITVFLHDVFIFCTKFLSPFKDHLSKSIANSTLMQEDIEDLWLSIVVLILMLLYLLFMFLVLIIVYFLYDVSRLISLIHTKTNALLNCLKGKMASYIMNN